MSWLWEFLGNRHLVIQRRNIAKIFQGFFVRRVIINPVRHDKHGIELEEWRGFIYVYTGAEKNHGSSGEIRHAGCLPALLVFIYVILSNLFANKIFEAIPEHKRIGVLRLIHFGTGRFAGVLVWRA